MFGSNANSTKRNKAQKRALRIVYKYYGKSLEGLLDIVAETTIHAKHLQILTYYSPVLLFYTPWKHHRAVMG